MAQRARREREKSGRPPIQSRFLPGLILSGLQRPPIPSDHQRHEFSAEETMPAIPQEHIVIQPESAERFYKLILSCINITSIDYELNIFIHAAWKINFCLEDT